MFDPLTLGMRALNAQSVWAPAGLFVAGAGSSIGPCVAPRLIAVAGLTANRSAAASRALLAAFVCGLVVTYAAFGAVASLLGDAARMAGVMYLLVALCFAAGGIVTLIREERSCEKRAAAANTGAAFLLGASFALIVSPCCTPMISAILAYAATTENVPRSSALLACFALGHALPICGFGAGCSGIRHFLSRRIVREAANLVSGTLMLALAGYYCALA